MLVLQPISSRSALPWAIFASLLFHLLALFVPQKERAASAPPPRLEARLAPQPVPAGAEIAQLRPSTVSKAVAPAKRLAVRGPSTFSVPTERVWSPAEKAEMNRFLDELAGEARRVPPPSLAQRATAMAREEAARMAQRDEQDEALLDRRPNSAPPSPFSLEMYLDGLVRRLNQSAAFARNDPRAKGVRNALVQFRVNPDGTMQAFRVVYEGDQAAEIAFIRSIVERAAPFSPFPPEINQAARAMTMSICIQPGRAGQESLGFSRAARGRGC